MASSPTLNGAYLFGCSYANFHPMPQICVFLICHQNVANFREISTNHADLDARKYFDHEFSQTSRLVKLKLHAIISTLTGAHQISDGWISSYDHLCVQKIHFFAYQNSANHAPATEEYCFRRRKLLSISTSHLAPAENVLLERDGLCQI